MDNRKTGSTTYLEVVSTTTSIGTLPGTKGVGAAPVVEVEAAILLEGASGQVAPVVAGMLLGVAMVISVGRALESRSIKPSLVVMSARRSISRGEGYM